MSVISLDSSTNLVPNQSEKEYVLLSKEGTVLVEGSSGSVVQLGTSGQVVSSNTEVQTILAGAPGPRGLPGIPESELVYSKRIDFISDSLLYRAEAEVGSAESAPVWRIRKVTIGTDGDVTETWAGGTALFDKVWVDRLTYQYL